MTLSFDLPNGQGGFRGKLQKDGDLPAIGTRPLHAARLASTRRRCSLKPDGANRWSGEVVPVRRRLHLLSSCCTKRPDGSLAAFLRNPERDFGALIGVERLVRDGSAVKLMGKRARQTEERELAAGPTTPENEVITLYFP